MRGVGDGNELVLRVLDLILQVQDTPLCCRGVAQCDFDEAKLKENLMALSATIEKNRPTGCKGKLWQTATISSTMGPGIRLDLASLKE